MYAPWRLLSTRPAPRTRRPPWRNIIYQQELNLLNKRTLAVIKTYAGQYDAGALDDATAEKLVREMIAIDEDTLKLNKSYLPKLLKVMPGMKVVRYMQIEHKIRAVVDYELSDAVPLVP